MLYFIILICIMASVAVVICIRGLWQIRQKARDQYLLDNVDPAIVLVQRQLYADGEFRRQVLSRSPMNLIGDRLRLECGHEMYYPSDMNSTHINCSRCAEQYLLTTMRAETKRKKQWINHHTIN